MEIKFECESSSRHQKGDYNPRFIMEKVISILEEKEVIKNIIFKYEGYSGLLYVYPYNDKNKPIVINNDTRKFYDDLTHELMNLLEFKLNKVEIYIRGWGEVYIVIDLNR